MLHPKIKISIKILFCVVGTIVLPAILTLVSAVNYNNKIDMKWALLNPFYVIISGWKVFKNPQSEEKKLDHWQYKVIIKSSKVFI